MKIKIAGMINDSIVDGPGLRFTVFTQGCHHHCPGCHNPNTHDPNQGYYVEIDHILEKVKKNPLLSGITISGGEPFLQIPEILELSKQIKAMNLDVIIYTGYTYEALINHNDALINEVLHVADYLIDGPFIQGKKSLTLLYRGSSNQRLIDLKKTNFEGKVIETDFCNY